MMTVECLSCSELFNVCYHFLNRHQLPVPEGFIITSEACQDFFSPTSSAELSPHLLHNLHQAITKLETKTGKKFNAEPKLRPLSTSPSSTGLAMLDPPLLLSVRSSTAAHLPGMTDTILNLGINDKSCALLAKQINPK